MPPSPAQTPALPRERLSNGVKLAYAAPTFALAGMAVPVFVYMSKFYADVVLVPLGYLAIAVAVARAFDAITDPLMGWLSDRTRSRWGRRRPWIGVAGPLCGLAFLALFSPPAQLGVGGSTLWFAGSFLAFFLFHTVFTIPYNALGPELTLDYHERSSLFGWRESCALLGTISAAVAPGLMLAWLGSERGAYTWMAVGYALALTGLGFAAVFRLRERPEFATRSSNPFVPGVRRALRNRPFRILLTSYVVGSVTAAIPGTLLPFFIAYVIRPEREVFWTTVGITSHFVAALASIPLWVILSRNTGKRPAWLSAYAMSILSLGGAFFLGEGDIVLGILVFAWAGVAFGGQILLTPSIQADVIDYDELHTGRRREAQYGALWALFPKLVAIPGAAIPLAVIGSMGYQPNVEQTPEVVLAIRSLLGLVPAAFATGAFVVAWRFPINERVHRAIQAGIEQHARGEPAEDPLTGEKLMPPGLRAVDEETGWLLDHFSPRELSRASDRGLARLGSDTARAACLSLAACVAATGLALEQTGNMAGEPGPLAVLSIAAAGLAFSGFVFHGIRWLVSRRLDAEALPASLLRSHLETSPGIARASDP